MICLAFYGFRAWNLSRVPPGYRRGADPLLANGLLVADLVLLAALLLNFK